MGFLFQNYNETEAQAGDSRSKTLGVAPEVQYGLSAFQAPDGSVITVKFIPKDDFDLSNIQELLEQTQEDRTQNTFTTYSTRYPRRIAGLHRGGNIYFHTASKAR